MGTGDVTALHGTSTSVFPAVPTSCAVAIDPRIHAVYVANSGDGSVTILDRTGRSVATISVGVNPRPLAMDPQRGLIYLAKDQGLTIVETQLPRDSIRKKTSESLAASNKILP
jgi:YVTN family beta-propeller protein